MERQVFLCRSLSDVTHVCSSSVHLVFASYLSECFECYVHVHNINNVLLQNQQCRRHSTQISAAEMHTITPFHF